MGRPRKNQDAKSSGRPKKPATPSVTGKKRGRPPKQRADNPPAPEPTPPVHAAPDKKPAGKPVGGLGDSAMVADPTEPVFKSDLKMVERAIRKRWPTRPEVKSALLAKIARIGLSTEDPRVLLGATRCYLQAEGQNQADELKGLPDKLVVTHETAPLDANGQRTAILRAITAEREKRAARRGH